MAFIRIKFQYSNTIVTTGVKEAKVKKISVLAILAVLLLLTTLPAAAIKSVLVGISTP